MFRDKSSIQYIQLVQFVKLTLGFRSFGECLSASIANSLGSSQHGRGTIEAAVLVDAGGGRKAEVGELAAHARVVLRVAVDGRDGVEDAAVLLGLWSASVLFLTRGERETYTAEGDVVNLGAVGALPGGGAGRGNGSQGGDDDGGEVHVGGWGLEWVWFGVERSGMS